MSKTFGGNRPHFDRFCRHAVLYFRRNRKGICCPPSGLRKLYSEVRSMGDLYNPFPKLPKNVRQIGDPDQVVRLYVEDYVNTYLKRLYPSGRQTMRVGVLLGALSSMTERRIFLSTGPWSWRMWRRRAKRSCFLKAPGKSCIPPWKRRFPSARFKAGSFAAARPVS